MNMNNTSILNSPRNHFDFKEFLRQSDLDYEQALSEMKNGEKSSHWIWYIFPQLANNGFSYNATFFGLKSLPEAVAYLNDPVLGPRLIEISEVALDWLEKKQRPIKRLMGSSIDALKLLSCATLFYYASKGTPHEQLFESFALSCQNALGGQHDTKTEEFCSQG
jgi:uncharacterized protein (DUF1810 family)